MSAFEERLAAMSAEARIDTRALELFELLGESVREVRDELSRRTAHDASQRLIAAKANSKDVAEGFGKMKDHFDAQIAELRLRAVARQDVAEVVKEMLFLDGSSRFSFDDFYAKSAERQLSARLNDLVPRADFAEQINRLEKCTEDIRAECRTSAAEIEAKADALTARCDSQRAELRAAVAAAKRDVLAACDAKFALGDSVAFLSQKSWQRLIDSVDELRKLHCGRRIERLAEELSSTAAAVEAVNERTKRMSQGQNAFRTELLKTCTADFAQRLQQAVDEGEERAQLRAAELSAAHNELSARVDEVAAEAATHKALSSSLHAHKEAQDAKLAELVTRLHKAEGRIDDAIKRTADLQTEHTDRVRKLKNELKALQLRKPETISLIKDSAPSLEPLCRIIDTKASVEDVNAHLAELHAELDARLTPTGKWLWQSGALAAGNRIAWDAEVLIGAQGFFSRLPNRFELIVAREGLYELSLGVFGLRKPIIGVWLNGQQVIGCARMRMADSDAAPSGAVGLTFFDFVVLPADARVWVTCDAAADGEAFFRLVKV